MIFVLGDRFCEKKRNPKIALTADFFLYIRTVRY